MNDITALAYDEAQRLLETCFACYFPYTCVIEDYGVAFEEQEKFYGQVEEELLLKGEKITRNGKYFKIDRYQR